ncbi:sulfotransferase family 2 domain-containing protein [Fodinibius sediminis]|uniref:Sulfotransferase family protein n=1 Tax=Fodinibius sediminis TaxID=1214077 RepID=A0A521BUW7_9BACT|nr:sulfotransferase family 2 domain-containing protein [Fodinibius sediminis]SMO50963.1 Sulfotransferase family protein [Fodinibius sediminis]
MIISLHMPKCGGTSFKELLQRHYKLRFSKDYDYPIHWTPEQREEETERARKRIKRNYEHFYRYRFVKCIHGHFLPYKYDHLYGKKNTVFITWLRDPIERIISHYYFWLRTYETDTPKPLHRRVVEEDWTLRQFAFSEELRNMYSMFLWNFPVERFDFIGLTEHYEQDVRYFADRYLGKDEIAVPQKNRSPRESKPGFEDEGLIRELKSFHARDYELYNHALELRNGRTVGAS